MSAETDDRRSGIAAQIVAADPGQSVWVSANAGTGKTRVLIDRIARLLLAGTPPRKILCLTFTKAAAAEMANRLNDRLGHWAAIDEPKLSASLENVFNRPPTAEETRRARRLFAETIEAPEGLRIRTIHSFCESLLGRFPLEAGVAPHFSVIDERRAAELRHEARDRVLLRSIDRDADKLAEAIEHLAGLVDENGFADAMAELDSNRARLQALTDAHGGLDGVIAVGRRALDLDPDDTAASVLAAAAAEKAFDGDGLRAAAETLSNGSPTDRTRAESLTVWLAADAQARADGFEAVYMPLYLTKQMQPRAASGLITKKSAEADPAAAESLSREQDRVAAVHARLTAIAVADNTAALLTIGDALLQAYAALKTSRALLDYDDLIEQAATLLDQDNGASWVHFKLDGGIDHILVDEAQDTSPGQWRIIESLAGDFFTGLGAHDQDNRTVFAVGDEKQSIYSFQGADPSRLGLMGERFATRVTAAEKLWRPVEMAVSWRSVAAVLKVVDAVFSDAEAADGLTWNARPIRHPTTRAGEAGLVELWPTVKPEPAPEADPWDAPLDQLSAASPEMRLAHKIADCVAAWLGGGETLEACGRRIEPGDILILVRRRGPFAEEMVRALKERDVRVAGRDRMVLVDHLAVMDLIAVGRFALLPDDDLNTATVLKGPFIEFDEATLFDLAYGRTGDLWSELHRRRDENPTFAAAHSRLSDRLAGADLTPPYEFFAGLLAAGGRADLVAHLGPEAGDPIDEFLALALDFERDHPPSLEGFLHWIETGETEVKRDLDHGGDEVRVMTVHGAKGLQAPIVFLADTCALPAGQLAERVRWGDGFVLWPAFKDNEGPVTEALKEAKRRDAEQEYRRLLYVAMTRAEDRLYVAGWEGATSPPEGCWYDLVERAMATMDDVVEIETESGETLRRLISTQIQPPEKIGSSRKSHRDVATPDWALRPPPPEPSPRTPLSPSRSDDEPPVISPRADDDGGRFRRGRLIHRLFQNLPDLPAEAWNAAATAFLATTAPELVPSARAEIADEVLRILHDPAFAALFGPGSRAEVPVVGGVGDGGEILISGQVDRLLITDEAVTVIDYKTNRPPPTTESEIAAVYLRQMATYRAAIGAIYPDRPVRVVLLWTDGPQAMELSDAVLDPHAP